MDSPVSAETHKTYDTYNTVEANIILKYIDVLVSHSRKVKPLYPLRSFICHANVNKSRIVKALFQATDPNDIRIDASILFWIYRTSVHLKETPTFTLSHICKIKIDNKEHFFITSKEDWIKHRKAVAIEGDSHSVAFSDHAKLKYLSRVLKLDIDGYLAQIPYEKLSGVGTRLDDGRVVKEVGEFQYIMDRDICVTILDKGMLTS